MSPRAALVFLFLGCLSVNLCAEEPPAPDVQDLTRRIGSGDEASRYNALQELSRNEGRAAPAIPAIAALILDQNACLNLRLESAACLGRIGAPACVAPLADALLDKNPHLRAYAARGLGLCGTAAAEAVPALKTAAGTDGHPAVRKFSVAALGLIGSADGLDVVRERAASDGDAQVRQKASIAARQLEEKREQDTKEALER